MPGGRQELADILTPITKGWGTDVGVELTSLAVQVHGGMGYVEETGVAQHYRDIRIAPIYEGTNGIQAIDLVGRKLGLRGGAAIDATTSTASPRPPPRRPAAGGDARRLSARHCRLPSTRCARPPSGCSTPADPNDALAGATPYLRMAGIVTGGWLLTAAALAATAAGDADGFSDEFLAQKEVTAHFYATQVLPQAAGLAPAVTAGAGRSLRCCPVKPARSGRFRRTEVAGQRDQLVGHGHLERQRLAAGLDRGGHRPHRAALGTGTAPPPPPSTIVTTAPTVAPAAAARTSALARASATASSRSGAIAAAGSDTENETPLSVNSSPATSAAASRNRPASSDGVVTFSA